MQANSQWVNGSKSVIVASMGGTQFYLAAAWAGEEAKEPFGGVVILSGDGSLFSGDSVPFSSKKFFAFCHAGRSGNRFVIFMHLSFYQFSRLRSTMIRFLGSCWNSV